MTKARATCDQGFYKLAEQCALALEVANPKSAEAMLLRGHVLNSFHRFAEAETIARELVKQRTVPFDHGLLGDALVEQGRLAEAVAAYQRMVDLRPDLQSYSRAANVRWLKGDLDGAIEIAQLMAGATSPLDSESASWALTRLGLYYFQAGLLADAKAACDAALSYSADYPVALLLKSRFLLSNEKIVEAVASAQRATEINPLPEFQWTLADTLRLAGRADEAAKVEAALTRDGAQHDPRTLALFLATRGEQIELAIELAQREFKSRADVFTHDALAWASLQLVGSMRHGLTWRWLWRRARSTLGSSCMPVCLRPSSVKRAAPSVPHKSPRPAAHVATLGTKTPCRSTGYPDDPPRHPNTFGKRRSTRESLFHRTEKGLKRTMKTTVTKLIAAPMLATALANRAFASSHMDAPLITRDPAANTTDVYAFVSVENGQKYLGSPLGSTRTRIQASDQTPTTSTTMCSTKSTWPPDVTSLPAGHLLAISSSSTPPIRTPKLFWFPT